MLITVKTLQQQQFTVEVDPNETIAAVKSKIEKSQNQPASWQKLIYSGKVLEDNTTIGSANIKDSEFLVLMVRKPKEEPAKAAPAPTTTTSTEKPAQPQVPVSSPAPSQPAEKPAMPTQEPTQASATPNTGIVMGAEYEKTITQLCEMGFPREDVIRALRAAFNNPDRAVEYLFNGIPNLPDIPQVQQRAPQTPQTPSSVPTASTPQTPTTPQQPAQTGQPTLSPNTPLIPPQFLGQQPQPSTPSTGTGVFDFLRQHPQFNALRMLVQQQPELLQPVLAQLAQANPNILQLINQHQQEFIQLLNEPVQPGSPGQSAFPGMPPMPGGPQYIQVTTEEKAAIDRLEKMGFERSLVIEAFFACDRDEEMAANYLLEHMHEDFEEDPQQQ